MMSSSCRRFNHTNVASNSGFCNHSCSLSQSLNNHLLVSVTSQTMDNLHSGIGGDSSSVHVYPRRVDFPHTQHLPHDHLRAAQQVFTRSSLQSRRNSSGTSYRQPVRASDRSHTSTQVRQPRGMPLLTRPQPYNSAVSEPGGFRNL